MYGKILISCNLKVLTGLHIGGSSAFSAIGAVDSPVVRDTRTNQPVVPGSSIKGKLRALLAKALNASDVRDFDGDAAEILRLFGSSQPVHNSRLQFADAYVLNAELFLKTGLIEVKCENSIDRVTCKPNPRQIERVVRDVEFGVHIVYNVETDRAEMLKDFENLARAMKLLQMDYLGGHGSRGSGRVSLHDFHLAYYNCCIDPADADKISALFKEVEDYELLPA